MFENCKTQLTEVPCGSRKRISHIIMPLTVRNDDDDVSHRLPGITLPFQEQVAAPIATQDYPFPVTGACARMIIIKIADQDSFQMTIVQHGDMVQAISPDAAQTFEVTNPRRIRAGRYTDAVRRAACPATASGQHR